jgi:hypothetical protein
MTASIMHHFVVKELLSSVVVSGRKRETFFNPFTPFQFFTMTYSILKSYRSFVVIHLRRVIMSTMTIGDRVLRQWSAMDNTYFVIRALAIDSVSNDVYLLCANHIFIINRNGTVHSISSSLIESQPPLTSTRYCVGTMDIVTEFYSEVDVSQRINPSSFTISSGDLYVVDDSGLVYSTTSI